MMMVMVFIALRLMIFQVMLNTNIWLTIGVTKKILDMVAPITDYSSYANRQVAAGSTTKLIRLYRCKC